MYLLIQKFHSKRKTPVSSLTELVLQKINRLKYVEIRKAIIKANKLTPFIASAVEPFLPEKSLEHPELTLVVDLD